MTDMAFSDPARELAKKIAIPDQPQGQQQKQSCREHLIQVACKESTTEVQSCDNG